MGRAVSGDDNEGKEEVGGETGDGEDEEGAGANAGGGFPSFVDFGGGEVGVCREDGVDVELADVGRNIEKKRKPSDPIKKLDFANFADLGWKAFQRSKDLAEKGDNPDFLGRWRAFQTGISFANIKAGDQDGAAKSKGSDDTQNLELRVPENAPSELR